MQVWNTLAHEAAHRMQDCEGGSLARPDQIQLMARTLSRYSPKVMASLGAYPRSQHNSEIEARYTAQLPRRQLMQLFDRYCGRTPFPDTTEPHPIDPMESLMMQLTLAALGQPSGPSQATTLAAVTCRMRQGEISRDRAIDDLNIVGRRHGWSQGWAQRIPLSVVDQPIGRSNGCQSLLSTLREHGIHAGPVAGGAHSGATGAGRSEVEGFGLAPYR